MIKKVMFNQYLIYLNEITRMVLNNGNDNERFKVYV
jgi:hypothetical protein